MIAASSLIGISPETLAIIEGVMARRDEPKTFLPLIVEDVELGIEEFLTAVEGRYFERGILAAATDEEAATWIKARHGNWGMYGGVVDANATSKGLRIERAGRGGTLAWLPLVRAVRTVHAEPQRGAQLALF